MRPLLRRFCNAPAGYLTGNKDIKPLRIDDKIAINQDSFVFRCVFDPDLRLGVPIGHHVRIHFADKKLEEGRTFTPISDLQALGKVDFLVKVYRPTPDFPKGGAMTQYLDSLKVGEEIHVSGPRGKYQYLGNGSFEFKNLKLTRDFSQVSFIAGGSGITPIFQILKNLQKQDQTKFNVLYSNKTPADILLKKPLDKLAAATPNLNLQYSVDRQASGWSGQVGRPDEKWLETHLPSPDDEDHLIFICGPKQMNEAVRQMLVKLGHPEHNIYFY